MGFWESYFFLILLLLLISLNTLDNHIVISIFTNKKLRGLITCIHQISHIDVSYKATLGNRVAYVVQSKQASPGPESLLPERVCACAYALHTSQD